MSEIIGPVKMHLLDGRRKISANVSNIPTRVFFASLLRKCFNETCSCLC